MHRLDKYLQKNQYGFRKHRATYEAIGAVRRAIAKGESTFTSTILLALDWEKAFDKVSHAALFNALQKNECTRKDDKLY